MLIEKTIADNGQPFRGRRAQEIISRRLGRGSVAEPTYSRLDSLTRLNIAGAFGDVFIVPRGTAVCCVVNEDIHQHRVWSRRSSATHRVHETRQARSLSRKRVS